MIYYNKFSFIQWIKFVHNRCAVITIAEILANSFTSEPNFNQYITNFIQ